MKEKDNDPYLHIIAIRLVDKPVQQTDEAIAWGNLDTVRGRVVASGAGGMVVMSVTAAILVVVTHGGASSGKVVAIDLHGVAVLVILLVAVVTVGTVAVPHIQGLLPALARQVLPTVHRLELQERGAAPTADGLAPDQGAG